MQTILCLGDSIMNEYVGMLKDGFAEQREPLDVNVVDFTVRGETSSEVLLRMSKLQKLGSEIVLIGYGMNDVNKNTGLCGFADNLHEIVACFRNKNTLTHLLSITPVEGEINAGFNLRINQYNEIIGEVAREEHIYLIDLYARWVRDIRPVCLGLSDGTHPNDLACRVCSDEVIGQCYRNLRGV